MFIMTEYIRRSSLYCSDSMNNGVFTKGQLGTIFPAYDLKLCRETETIKANNK